MPSRKASLMVIFSLLATSCGGGGGSEGTGGVSAPPPPIIASPTPLGGIWTGTDGLGNSLLGVITEAGEGYIVRTDNNWLTTGTFSSTGSSVNGSYKILYPVGTVLSDGSAESSGNAVGNVQSKNTLQLEFRSVTKNGLGFTTTGSLTFNSQYNNSSSLSIISGNYRDTRTGGTVNISSSGVVFSQDPTTNCFINGTIATIDTRFNAYRVSFSFTGCRFGWHQYNDTTASGLMILDYLSTPRRTWVLLGNPTVGPSAVSSYSFVKLYDKI